jgi:hypothetical protein
MRDRQTFDYSHGVLQHYFTDKMASMTAGVPGYD